jgi:hypothetical protein
MGAAQGPRGAGLPPSCAPTGTHGGDARERAGLRCLRLGSSGFRRTILQISRASIGSDFDWVRWRRGPEPLAAAEPRPPRSQCLLDATPQLAHSNPALRCPRATAGVAPTHPISVSWPRDVFSISVRSSSRPWSSTTGHRQRVLGANRSQRPTREPPFPMTLSGRSGGAHTCVGAEGRAPIKRHRHDSPRSRSNGKAHLSGLARRRLKHPRKAAWSDVVGVVSEHRCQVRRKLPRHWSIPTHRAVCNTQTFVGVRGL